MRASRHLIWLVLFGAAWGMNEVFAGGAGDKQHSTLQSVWLVACAFLVLSTARALFNKPGSSTAIGCIAALFKTINTAPFTCHLLGIVMLGVAYDITATLWVREKRKPLLENASAGFVGVYLGQALFIVMVTYIFRHPYWASVGFSKVFDHVFVTGSLAALAAAFLCPAGFLLGRSIRKYADLHPRWVFSGAVAVCAILWAVGISG